MGQEVSVTSVQLARLGAVIANGGMLVKPRLILKRGDKAEPVEPPVRVIKPETAITMRQMMEGVVLRGTGRLHAQAGRLYVGRQDRHRADLRFRDASLHAQLQRFVSGLRAGDESGAGGAGDGAQHLRRKRPGSRCGRAGIPEDHDRSAAHAGCAERYSGRAGRREESRRRRSRASSQTISRLRIWAGRASWKKIRA